MTALLIYLLKSAAVLAVMYAVYYLFLRRDTFFMINRFYLLGAIVISGLIPFIPLRLTATDTVSTLVVALSPVSVSAKGLPAPSSAGLNIIEILTVIYLTGVGIFLMKLVFQLFQIMLLIRKSDIRMQNILRVVYTEEGFSPFSFFNYVFVNRKRIGENELKTIIAHELVHVKQRHSLDLLFFELICTIQWFNPFMWMALKDLQNLHEYLADEGALHSGVSGEDYRELILNEAVGARLNYITNNFNISTLKNRILMMTKPRSSALAKGKPFIALPVIICTLIFFAGNSSGLKIYAQDNQTPQYNQYETQAGSPVLTPPRHHDPPQDKQVKEVDNAQKKVEKQLEYPGGTEMLFKFLMENLKYPEKARLGKIQGKVFISFIVKADGSIGDAKVMRGIGGGCDEEALRVVKLMPKWKPGEDKGKPVDVSMILPVNFAFDSTKTDKK